MPFSLDAAQALPLYEQIVATIRAQVMRGALRPGDRLPTVRELATQLGVNQNTVVRAYGLLRADGLIEARRGQGTRVARGLAIGPESLRENELRALTMQTIADGVARGFDAAEIEGAFVSQLARWRAENPGGQPATGLRGQIIGMGSNDISLQLLAERYQQLHQGTRIVIADVGSLAGLMAMVRGEAHFAASHLYDPKSGDYNIPTLRRLFPRQAITLVTLASRAQGFIVPAGNPKRIATIQDLARRRVRMVNRQRGSGTRVLLDELLRTAHIPQHSVRGFDREETTHAAVAAAVAHGAADVGIGIQAAAQAFGLDFVPLRWERFELVFPHGAPLVSGLVESIKRPEFQRAVLALGGYDLKMAGQIRTVKA